MSRSRKRKRCGSFIISLAAMQKAKKLHRSSDTVSRYVREFEAAVGAASIVMNAKNIKSKK